MFQEEIADLTAIHLSEHIRANLEAVEEIYLDAVKIQFPKSIETNNLVGGVYNATPKEMPAYAIDIISKAFSEEREGLWLYSYDGHIAGVVSGNNEATVNKIVKRHQQAVEMFVRQHMFMHQISNKLVGNAFTIIELQFTSAAFSGAELVDKENDRETWIAGFRIDLFWIVSEDGPGQHV